MPGCNQNEYQSARQAQIFAGNRAVQQCLRNDYNMSREMNSDYMIDSFPVGMAYVPWQKWQNIYEPEQALMAGTLFRDLDLRFYGVRGCKR